MRPMTRLLQLLHNTQDERWQRAVHVESAVHGQSRSSMQVALLSHGMPYKYALAEAVTLEVLSSSVQ